MLGFLVVNDNFPMDLEKPQMLRCIICRIEQSSVLDLCQYSTLQKNLIKYGKINGITPMKTHVEYAHPKLVACKMVAITAGLVATTSHN
jgi:hypothetical protein